MRQLAALLLIWACLEATAVPAASPDFGTYRALVIGIDDYRHLRPLRTAVVGAEAVHELVQRRYGFQSTLLLNPDRDTLVRALDHLRETLGERDNLLIYYAGHGYLDRQTDEGFWLPANAEESSQVEWVPVSTVTRLLRATVAKHVLVIADSCYSGTLTRDAGVALPTGADRQAELARLNAKRARKALTSGGLEPVDDGGGDGHSVFTRALLRALQENEHVLDGDGLFRAVRRQVVVNAPQTPEYADVRFAGHEGGDFLFVPVGGAPETAVAAIGQTGVFLAGSEIKGLLVGNTIRFKSPQNGRMTRLYFDPKNRVEAVQEGRAAVAVRKTWWITGHPALCRTYGREDERICQKLVYDPARRLLTFHKMDGDRLFEAELLDGRQLGD